MKKKVNPIFYILGVLAMVIAFALFMFYEKTSNDFQKIAESKGKLVLGDSAIVTIRTGETVYHYQQLKEPYLNALRLYLEASLYDLIESDNNMVTSIIRTYDDLAFANPNPEKFQYYGKVYQSISWVNINFTRMIAENLLDSLAYRDFLATRRAELSAEMTKHNKSIDCLLLEANTLTHKINRGMFSDILYIDYEITVEIPVTDKISYIKTFMWKDYLKEDLFIDSEFKRLLPEIREFRKKLAC